MSLPLVTCAIMGHCAAQIYFLVKELCGYDIFKGYLYRMMDCTARQLVKTLQLGCALSLGYEETVVIPWGDLYVF